MNYIEYKFIVTPKDPGEDLLAAELGAIGFESFLFEEEYMMAYISKDKWMLELVETLPFLSSPIFKISFSFKEIIQKNWNEEWEKNFHPIMVDDQCMVRAPFHDKSTATYDILIEPKMSFGTGHHETTHMMIQHLLNLEVVHKKVLDMGCGTGILAILAEMKGAKAVDAIDINNWCFQNSLENATRNKCKRLSVYEGDASLIKESKYNVIIANINRNILLSDMHIYANALLDNGVLLLSGFYEKDIPVIDECCLKLSLKLVKKLEKNSWVSLKYVN